MYENIIVPLDGSDASRQVLPYARSIAKTVGATLHLIGVLEPLNRVDNLSRMGSGAQNAPMSQSGTGALRGLARPRWRAAPGGARSPRCRRGGDPEPGHRNDGGPDGGEAAEQIIAAGNRAGESLIAMSTTDARGSGAGCSAA